MGGRSVKSELVTEHLGALFWKGQFWSCFSHVFLVSSLQTTVIYFQIITPFRKCTKALLIEIMSCKPTNVFALKLEKKNNHYNNAQCGFFFKNVSLSHKQKRHVAVNCLETVGIFRFRCRLFELNSWIYFTFKKGRWNVCEMMQNNYCRFSSIHFTLSTIFQKLVFLKVKEQCLHLRAALRFSFVSHSD